MGIEKLTTYPSHIQTPCLQPGLYESEWSRSLVFDHNTTTQHHEKGDTLKMQLVVQGFSKEYVIEVGEDDTTATMRQKVASAEGLCEDSFRMGFGGKDEGEDIRELSAGETITLTKSLKYEAISALHALGETDITAERLGQVRDPQVASLLLQAEVATAIPDDFFSDGASVTHIVFSYVSDADDNRGTTLHLPALPCVVAIGRSFFSNNCRRLSTVELSGLQSVTTIGDNFLYNCTALSTVDLSGLQSVTTIGDNFLYNCTALSTVDLSGLQAVTTIGYGFLSDCTALSTVDLSGLQAVTTIDDCFLNNCTALSTVDLSGLQSVTTIGDNFLYNCTALSTVDLSGLRAVTTIGYGFLSDCTALSTVDLSGLQAVTTIGRWFLSECTALQTVHGKDKCSTVVRSRATKYKCVCM